MEPEGSAYGEGFAAVYVAPRYAVFSRRLARLALQVIDEAGAPGRRLLDLACGAGAGSAVLAQAGYTVTGVDRSETMVQHARKQAAASGLDISFKVDDMRSFRSDQSFDVVTSLFDAINYITEEADLAKVFHSVAAALNPGGLFIFDLNTASGLSTRWGTRDRVFTNRADVFEVNQSNFDEQSAVNTTVTTIFVRVPDGQLFRRYTEIHKERAYSMAVLKRLLHEAGFSIERTYGVPDSQQGVPQKIDPDGDDAGRVIIAARRAAGP